MTAPRLLSALHHGALSVPETDNARAIKLGMEAT